MGGGEEALKLVGLYGDGTTAAHKLKLSVTAMIARLPHSRRCRSLVLFHYQQQDRRTRLCVPNASQQPINYALHFSSIFLLADAT